MSPLGELIWVLQQIQVWAPGLLHDLEGLRVSTPKSLQAYLQPFHGFISPVAKATPCQHKPLKPRALKLFLSWRSKPVIPTPPPYPWLLQIQRQVVDWKELEELPKEPGRKKTWLSCEDHGCPTRSRAPVRRRTMLCLDSQASMEIQSNSCTPSDDLNYFPVKSWLYSLFSAYVTGW